MDKNPFETTLKVKSEAGSHLAVCSCTNFTCKQRIDHTVLRYLEKLAGRIRGWRSTIRGNRHTEIVTKATLGDLFKFLLTAKPDSGGVMASANNRSGQPCRVSRCKEKEIDCNSLGVCEEV